MNQKGLNYLTMTVVGWIDIHFNPIRAKIIAEPQHYLYSSAANYATENRHGLFEIDLIELPPFGASHLYFPK